MRPASRPMRSATRSGRACGRGARQRRFVGGAARRQRARLHTRLDGVCRRRRQSREADIDTAASRGATRAGASLGWPGIGFCFRSDRRDDDDPLTALETAKDRVRILLDRYGVISREIANREGGVFRWAALFRALRIMELSGEIVSGLFFNGLSGPQFAAPAAVRQLERGAARRVRSG